MGDTINKKNKPIVSVVVPVYNVQQYLSQCLDSLLNQTYINWEAIIVDDGSTDNSGIICDRYVERDTRFHVIHKNNGGLASARNAAMPYIRGTFTMFLDSDDYIALDLLNVVVRAMESENADVIQVQFTRDEKTLGNREDTDLIGKLSEEEVYDDVLKYKKISPIVCGKLYKTNIIKNIRYNELCYVLEDVEFQTRVMKKASWYIDNYIGYYYRPTPGSLITQGLNIRKLQGSIACQNSCIVMLENTSLRLRAYEFKYNSLFNWLIRTAKQYNWMDFYNRIKEESKSDIKIALKCKELGIKAKVVLTINMICPALSHYICKQK